MNKKKFWTARLAFILLNAPLILALQLWRPDWLVSYLVWMSWLAWVSAELPNPEV